MKIIKTRWFLLSIAVCMLVALTGCASDNGTVDKKVDISTSSAVQTNNNSENLSSTNSETDVNRDEADTPQQSGYCICRLEDCDNKVLLILNGESDASREFVFYLINGSELENIGSLDGSNITAYISNETKCLSICKSDQKSYLYGSVKYDEGIFVDWTETLIPQGNVKHIHIDGKKISFNSFENSEFVTKYADKINYDEEISEIEE